jgi:hypothetical protein
MESSTNDQELKSSKELDAYQPEKEYLVAEYTALRAEMQSRSQAQRQLLSLAFIISGTLLTIGVTHNTQDLFFLIPLILSFLSVGWGDHDRAIKMISSYIREQIEPYAPGLEWANSIQQLESEKPQAFGGFLISTHVRGTFLLLQLLPIGLALSQFKWEMRSIVLLGLDVIAIILTWFVLRHRPRMKNILSNNSLQRTDKSRR